MISKQRLSQNTCQVGRECSGFEATSIVKIETTASTDSIGASGSNPRIVVVSNEAKKFEPQQSKLIVGGRLCEPLLRHGPLFYWKFPRIKTTIEHFISTSEFCLTSFQRIVVRQKLINKSSRDSIFIFTSNSTFHLSFRSVSYHISLILKLVLTNLKKIDYFDVQSLMSYQLPAIIRPWLDRLEALFELVLTVVLLFTELWLDSRESDSLRPRLWWCKWTLRVGVGRRFGCIDWSSS